MVETTEEYRNRINQLANSVGNELYLKDMRDNIAEGISKTGNRQADIEIRQDTLESDFVAVQQDARSNTPSGAELAVAAGEYNTLGERLDKEQQKVNAQLAQTVGLDVTTKGAIANGVATNDDALAASVIESKKLYFPQNEANNAVYYFETTPVLDGLNITADEGVVLSVPTTNAKTFKNVEFSDGINIFSRDRNNTGKILKNNTEQAVFNILTENDADVGVKKLKIVADSSVSKNIYTAGALGTIAPAPLVYDDSTGMYYMANASDITQSFSKMATLEFSYDIGNLYSCDFEFTVPETSSNTNIGVTATKDGTNWGTYVFRLDGQTLKGVNNAGTWSSPPGRRIDSLVNDAYLAKKGYVISTRAVSKTEIEIYLNGFYCDSMTFPFEFSKLGFGMFTVNAEGQGLQNTKWGRLVTGVAKKTNYGDTLTIAAFSDSKGFGEGNGLSYIDFLPRLLNGQKGITKTIINNYAVSGNRSEQQLIKMQNTNLEPNNIVLIEIGTNDIQSQISLSTFKSNVQSMINLGKASGRKVVIGIPPLWISQALTGTGAATSNYEKGAAYRSTLMYLAAANEVAVFDLMSEFGRINLDNHMNTLRDNLHWQDFGQILAARCAARSILSTITTDL